MNKKIAKILLILITALALVLRVYKISEVPPAISWDEAAVGYNAWTIANYGRDEYGNFFPLIFRSFGDDKQPVNVYITAIFVKIFGLNEFSTRFPAALFGVLNVLLIFYLVKLLFKNEIMALSAALFLAVSPYNLHFSRFNHEANIALFFVMLGITTFYLSLSRNNFLLALSTLSFGISFMTYLPAKLVSPLVVLFLTALYFKKIVKNKIGLIGSAIVIGFFIFLIYLSPHLVFSDRISQTTQGQHEIESTDLYKKTHNLLLGRLNLIATQYSWHFSPNYLFIQGDKNPRLSSQTGQFYKIDAVLLIFGLIYLLYKRSRVSWMVLCWALVAPLPSALVNEAPHAARAMFMMGSWQIVSAAGLYFIIDLVRKPIFKGITLVVVIAFLSIFLKGYLSYYYGEYATRYAIEWQYGMKQIVSYVKDHDKDYEQVFVTDARSQPYIFFLYYLQTPLPDYLNSALYNNSISQSYNNVSTFDKYYFGGWDPIESLPTKKVLYVVTPSQYDGLRHKADFDVKKLVYYPNGLTAFYLVSTK